MSNFLLSTAVLCFLISALGITAGAHRLWSHRTYKASLPLRIFLAVANSMAFEVQKTTIMAGTPLHSCSLSNPRLSFKPPERHLWMGSRPQGSSQIFGDGRRSPQRPPRLLLRPHRLAAGAQTPRRHRERKQAGAQWPVERQSCDVPAEVDGSTHRRIFTLRKDSQICKPSGTEGSL